jgi:hypothetical protein
VPRGLIVGERPDLLLAEIECREPNDLPSGDEAPSQIWSRVLDLDPAT